MATTSQRRPFRIDRAPGPKGATRTDNGWLRAPARLTRVGVFPYQRADGTVRLELRPPEEVFDSESLESFALVPITDDHPPESAGLTADNASQYARGAVGENVRQAGDFVEAALLITDSALVAKVEAGKSELSCGYFCDLDETPGVHPKFGRYDAIQRGIRGNHVAVVEVGRAGPEVRIKMDAADAAMAAFSTLEPQEPINMAKHVIEGIEFEVSEQVAQALVRKDAADAAKLADMQKKASEAQAKADASKVEIEKLQAKADAAEKARADAADPAKFNAAVSERVELLAKAREIIGDSFKADGLDAQAIRCAVIAKLAPEVKLDGKSVDYVAAFYDAVTKNAIAVEPSTSRVDSGVAGAPVNLAEQRKRFDEAVRKAHEVKQ